jgi:hypothetical protein
LIPSSSGNKSLGILQLSALETLHFVGETNVLDLDTYLTLIIVEKCFALVVEYICKLMSFSTSSNPGLGGHSRGPYAGVFI